MRIAFVTSLFPVLSETPFLNQITGLIARGHELDIYADQPQASVRFHPDVERFRLLERTRHRVRLEGARAERWAEAVRVIRAHAGPDRWSLIRSLNPFLFWRRAWSLEQFGRTLPYLPRCEYDICYCAFGQDGVKGLRIRQVGALGGKFVIAFRGADTTKYVVRRGRNTYAGVFRHGDLFMPVSDEFARRLVGLGCPPSRIVVHRTGIDLSRFPFRERCLEPGGTVRLVSVGRLVEKKAIADVLHAVRRAISDGVRIEYDVLGDGPLRPMLTDLARDLGLAGCVRFHGWQLQADVQAVLDRSHVLAAPSVTAANGDEEGIPNVLKEAMAMGLPVLSTRHSGIPELVEDGVSGFLAPERDPEALAVHLRWLATHPERWPEMGRAGRARVERDYDIEKLNDRLVDIYEQLLSPRRHGGHRGIRAPAPRRPPGQDTTCCKNKAD